MADLSNVRVGRITSSDIVALTTSGRTKGEKGAPFYTYVQECIMERFFKQNLENKIEVLPMAWGKLCENIVHDLLPFDYIFQSNKTETHPKIKEWVGTPDGTKIKTILKKEIVDTVTDIKCPLTRKSFYGLVRLLYDFDGITATKKKEVSGKEIMDKIRFGYTDENGMKIPKHADGEKFYWQLVSNACILGAKYAELIVFMPYYEDLEMIHEYNNNLEEGYWVISRAKEGELPFIYKETGIERINIIRFEVPLEDKKFLEERVISAIELINA